MGISWYTISQLSLTGSGSSCMKFEKCSHASLVTYCNDIHNRCGLYLQLRGWPDFTLKSVLFFLISSTIAGGVN